MLNDVSIDTGVVAVPGNADANRDPNMETSEPGPTGGASGLWSELAAFNIALISGAWADKATAKIGTRDTSRMIRYSRREVTHAPLGPILLH
jgi:hypothetical protein